jgi:hypothetical protein
MTGSEGHTIGVRHARSRRGRSKGRYRLSDSSILVLPPSGAAGGRQILVRDVATGREIDESFASLSRDKADALFVAPGSFFNTQRVQLAVLAARYALPGVYAVHAYTEAGGLMSYGTDILDAFRQVGAYTARMSRVRSQRTCRFSSRPSLNWCSISIPRRRSA